MDASSTAGRMAPSTAELQIALEASLVGHVGSRPEIVILERRTAASCTSFPLEEIDIGLHDGTKLELIFKDLSRLSLSEPVRRAKPEFLYDPLREIEMYRSVLDSKRLGTPFCYGISVDEPQDRYWLFLEKVHGRELFQFGELSVWQKAARWLADMHTLLTDAIDLRNPRWREHVLTCDKAYYWLWILRAQEFAHDSDTPGGRRNQEFLEWLAGRYDRVVDLLLALPATLVHGEFYASNVLIEERPNDVRICPVDWEMAAIAPALMDLAALTAGRWTDDERVSLESAYYEGLTPIDDARMQRDAFAAALDCCRLHQAVQWLGWSRDWSPPREQAQDWMSEAMRLATRLEL